MGIQGAFLHLRMIIAIAIFLIVAPIIPLIGVKHWGVRFFDFVRLQTLTLQVTMLFLLIYLWDTPTYTQWFLQISLLLCIVYQAFLIFPYTFLNKQPKRIEKYYSQPLKLITANVLQTNTSYQKFIGEIQRLDPHLFITMESDQHWDDAIGKELPVYKHTTKVSLSNFYGMHLYSKIPLDHSQVQFLVEEDVPSIRTILTYLKHEIQIIAVHPAPPSPTENKTSKERDAELMIVAKQCRQSNISTIVCGDLNDVAWSRSSRLFRKITGFLDPRLGKGLYPTFHASYWLLRFPLDHLFYSKDLNVPVLERLRRFDSDHFGMYYEIQIPYKEADVENPTLTPTEHTEIKDIISEGLEEASKD